jgi:hypothetical protein
METTMNPRNILAEARRAGIAAWKSRIPVPMIVQDGNQVYAPVLGGVCGFAHVNFPNRGKFVTHLKEKKLGHPNSYSGGYDVSPYELMRGTSAPSGPIVQSLEKQEAFCLAFRDVLINHGIDAKIYSRMD